MSLLPIGCAVTDGMQCDRGMPISDGIVGKYGDQMKVFEEFGLSNQMFSQFAGCELLARKYGLDRAECDRFAAVSNDRAWKATHAGKFKREIAAIPCKLGEKSKVKLKSMGELHTTDEGIRDGVTSASLAKMKGLHEHSTKDSRITAASASQICDGAAAILVANEAGLKKLGLKPRARIVSMAVVGHDPVIMLEGPIPATKKALEKAKMTIKDMDRYEVNEAFASVALAWKKALGADESKLNVKGGAMALGHPIGATGAKLMTTLVHELEDCGGKYGLLAVCEGGGTANCTIIENLGGKRAKL